MAVDYFHRLVVSGRRSELEAFRRSASRVVWRKLAGMKRSWRERVPISFAAMYARCPELTRIEAEQPNDPYDLSAWPIVALPHGRAESRYQFHTRNLEMRDFFKLYSRTFARLEFVLVTFCLDGNSIDTYLIRNGRVRKYTLPEKRHEWHWREASKRLGIAVDEISENDDELRPIAEGAMLDEALDHWERFLERARKKTASAASVNLRKDMKSSRGRRSAIEAGHENRKRDWWNRKTVRDLEFEREILLAESAAAADMKDSPATAAKVAKSFERFGLLLWPPSQFPAHQK